MNSLPLHVGNISLVVDDHVLHRLVRALDRLQLQEVVPSMNVKLVATAYERFDYIDGEHHTHAVADRDS